MGLRPGGEDLILVLGGDGSILRALAREAGLGRPGDRRQLRPRRLPGLHRARDARARPAPRPRRRVRRPRPAVAEGRVGARARCRRSTTSRSSAAARSRIADLTYAVDGELVATVRCDGVVLSTPVGSTAYNLAAGGPTVSWRVRCFVLSFIALHHLDSRPLVIGAEETAHGHQQRPRRRLSSCRPTASASARSAPGGRHGGAGRRRGPPGHVPRGVRSSGATGRSSAGRDPLARGPRPRGDRAGRDRAAGRASRRSPARPAPGKTVLAQALGLLAGAPADAGGVRPGRAPRAGAGRRSPCPTGSGTGWTRTTRPLALRELAEDEDEVVIARRVPGRGPGAGADRRPGGAARGGRGAGAGADALLGPARAPPAGRARPASSPSSTRSPGPDVVAGAERLRALRRRAARRSTGRWPRPRAPARGGRARAGRPGGAGGGGRRGRPRPRRGGGAPAPSASGCATPRAWRRRPPAPRPGAGAGRRGRAPARSTSSGGAAGALEPADRRRPGAAPARTADLARREASLQEAVTRAARLPRGPRRRARAAWPRSRSGSRSTRAWPAATAPAPRRCSPGPTRRARRCAGWTRAPPRSWPSPRSAQAAARRGGRSWPPRCARLARRGRAAPGGGGAATSSPTSPWRGPSCGSSWSRTTADPPDDSCVDLAARQPGPARGAARRRRPRAASCRGCSSRCTAWRPPARRRHLGARRGRRRHRRRHRRGGRRAAAGAGRGAPGRS